MSAIFLEELWADKAYEPFIERANDALKDFVMNSIGDEDDKPMIIFTDGESFAHSRKKWVNLFCKAARHVAAQALRETLYDPIPVLRDQFISKLESLGVNVERLAFRCDLSDEDFMEIEGTADANSQLIRRALEAKTHFTVRFKFFYDAITKETKADINVDPEDAVSPYQKSYIRQALDDLVGIFCDEVDALLDMEDKFYEAMKMALESNRSLAKIKESIMQEGEV